MRHQLEPLRGQDPEGIHQMRVASRRLRAILKENRKLYPKDRLKGLEDDARAITRGLGKARELDVSIALLEGIRSEMHGPPRHAANHALRHMRRLRAAEWERIRDTADLVGSEEFQHTFHALTDSKITASRCIVENAIRSTTRQFRDVQTEYILWLHNPTDDQLHALRIAFKKLRYTAEFYRKTYGRKMEKFILALKDVQGALGDWHDLCVLSAYVEEARKNAPPKAMEGMKDLLADLRARARGLLEAFREHATQFFTDARQNEINTFLTDVEEKCCLNGHKKKRN
jgi:CHAD domain-containing protein